MISWPRKFSQSFKLLVEYLQLIWLYISVHFYLCSQLCCRSYSTTCLCRYFRSRDAYSVPIIHACLVSILFTYLVFFILKQFLLFAALLLVDKFFFWSWLTCIINRLVLLAVQGLQLLQCRNKHKKITNCLVAIIFI